MQNHTTPLYQIGEEVLFVDTAQSSKLKIGYVTIVDIYYFRSDEPCYFVKQRPEDWREDWVYLARPDKQAEREAVCSLHDPDSDDYFSKEEHTFMCAVTETLTQSSWDEDDARAIASEALTCWQNGFRWEI